MTRAIRICVLLAGCLLVWSGPAAPAAAAAAAAADLTRLTAAELAERLGRGEVSAVEVTRAHLARIAAVDVGGPRLNAILEINPDAEAIASALDRHRAAHGPKGPLHGVPVVLKGNIDTGDRMTTSAGSLALAEFRAADDAHLVARLRDAGAVILGKANLSEWANFRSTRSSSGWSSHGGQTLNPHVLDRNPCGSSSGSAVAVAAQLVPLAVGTETDGSIVCPSGVNGIVGIKPTVGTVSRHGIIPISHTQDTAGPMARTVTDAALLLSALVGYDPGDPAPRRFPEDAGPRLPDPAGVRLDGLRIGVNRGYYGAGEHPRVDAVFEDALAVLAGLGATLVDPVTVTVAPESSEAEYQVMLYEFKAGLNDYLAARAVPADRNSLAALIAWNEANAAAVMPHFGQEIFLAAEEKGGLDDDAYLEALAAGPARVRADLDAALAEHRLDAIITAANSYAWKTDWLAGDRYLVGSSALAAMSGHPSITLPAGDVRGLPVNVAFVGAAFAEPLLIRIAYAFEQAAGASRTPEFLETLERRD
jgi:amidase